MTNDMIAMASNWEERLWAPKDEKKDDPQVWATSFPNLITLTKREKNLNPKAMTTYKRPTTIGQLLTKYKHLALSKKREHVKGMSGPCGHCALCGNHGKHNKSMVPCVSQIMGKNKTFPLNQKLTCANHGIYVATCVICHEQYVRQTKKKFSTRWPSHRSNCNRLNCEIDENNKDKVALLWHFSESHGNMNKPPIHEACTVTFVEETNSLSLDFCEDTWYHKLNAQINIQNMILPQVR